jgi:hypothetical protein
VTPTQAQELIDEFVSDPEVQSMVAEALDYCAALSSAVALTHGFHEDENNILESMNKYWDFGNECRGEYKRAVAEIEWLKSSTLQAEFGRVMSEAGEAIENIRKPGPDSHCPQFPGWHVEAIDILVRVFDTLGKRGVLPGKIFVAKTLVNNGRARKHGKNS